MAEKPRRVLADHARDGKKLVPPWAKVSAEVIDWEGLFLPEHLWLAYLISDGDVSHAAELFNQACDILDPFYLPRKGDVFLGYVSDFARIPEEKQVDAIQRLTGDPTARSAIGPSFRAVVALYPGGAAEWLSKLDLPRPDKELGLRTMRELVRQLRAPRSKATVQCRMLGLNRLLGHDKIKFSPKVVDEMLGRGLAAYPHTDARTAERVEQFVRINMNMIFSHRELTNWPSLFWGKNFELCPCR